LGNAIVDRGFAVTCLLWRKQQLSRATKCVISHPSLDTRGVHLKTLNKHEGPSALQQEERALARDMECALKKSEKNTSSCKKINKIYGTS